MDLSDYVAAPEAIKGELREALARNGHAQADGSPPLLSGWRFYCFENLPSTMDAAAALAGSLCSGAFAEAALGAYPQNDRRPAVVLALEQEQGRGRNGRTWLSSAYSGIYVTFLCFPSAVPAQLLGCSLAAALAVREFFGHYGVDAGVKWPNDVLTRYPVEGKHRKLAGILVEANSTGGEVGALCIGVGANLNQQVFPRDVPGTSILQRTGKRVQYCRAAAALCECVAAVLQRYFASGFSAFHAEFEQHSLAQGAAIRWRSGGRELTGRVEGVREDGGLRVKTFEQFPRELVLFSGEIELEQTANG